MPAFLAVILPEELTLATELLLLEYFTELLAVAGLGLLFLPGMGAKGRLFGLALASLGAAGALAVFCRWQVPQPAGLEQPWQQLVSAALDGWFGGARQAAVLYAAGLGALAVLAAAAGLLWGRQSKKGKEES